MDSGAYMENKMDDLITSGILQQEEKQGQLDYEDKIDNELFLECLKAIRWTTDNMAIVDNDLLEPFLKIVLPLKARLEDRLGIIPFDRSASGVKLPF